MRKSKKTRLVSSLTQQKRLVRRPLLLANFGEEGRPKPIILNINKEVLAETIGATRSRVRCFMNEFRDFGFIAYNGKFEIHCSLLRVVLSNWGRRSESHLQNQNAKTARTYLKITNGCRSAINVG